MLVYQRVCGFSKCIICMLLPWPDGSCAVSLCPLLSCCGSKLDVSMGQNAEPQFLDDEY